MLPTDFKYRNLYLGKPKTMTDEECTSLPVWTDGEQFISFWRFSKEDLEEVNRTGGIYTRINSAIHPPIELTTECPLTGDYVKPGDLVEAKVPIPGTDQVVAIEGEIKDVQGLLVVETTGGTQVPYYRCREVYFI